MIGNASALASVVEGLESMTSYPVTSLAWVRSPGGASVVSAEEGSLVLCNSPGTMVRKIPAYMTEILLGKGVK
jgi:hypothetical protein